MANIKQSTAYTRMFLMVQSSDHITPITGATVAVNISKAGAAGAAAGGTVSQVDATNMPGWYKIALTTTDTGTLGDLAYHCTATSADPSDFVDQVTANILGDTLPANTTQWNGTNVSAATAGIPDVNVKNINNTVAATPGAAGGVLISGSNAGTTTFGALTVTGTATVSDGLVVARSTTNASAITATGNGTGSGAVFTSGSAATGDGVQMVAASTNGNGLNSSASGSGSGIKGNGGTSGFGINAVGGSSTGDGIQGIGGGNGAGLSMRATGSQNGMVSIGSSPGAGFLVRGGSTGVGLNIMGGSTSGIGVAISTTSGAGLTCAGGGANNGATFTSGAGATGDGIAAVAASTNGNGFTMTHAGTGKDLNATTTNLAVASVAGAVASVTGNIGGNVVGSVGSVTAAVTVDGTSALTEAYPTQGAGLTMASALYGINQMLNQKAVSGTTVTVKKRDGSTTAKTFTLDSATTPTSISETT